MRTARQLHLVAFTTILVAAASCGSSEADGPNLLRNGTFDEGTAGWTFWSPGDGGEPEVTEGELRIPSAGPDRPNLIVGQQGLALEHGAWYELSYRAAADFGQDLAVGVLSPESPGVRKPYAPSRAQALTATMSRYTRTFLMAYPGDDAAALELFLDFTGSGTVRLDDLSLKKISGRYRRADPPVEFPKVVPNVDRENLIVYEVVPPSYNGGRWEGGDNLRGITSRLDRIRDLGVNVIWLTPVFEGSGMGYWTRDYYEVNPNLGTVADLKELVYEAHRRDLLVILDFVPNHTWTEHPFFQDVRRRHGASEYADYYVWYGTPGASDFFHYFDWVTLPNVNLSNPEVVEYMLQVAAHWVAELDLDGYRVDCAWALEERSPIAPGFGFGLRARIESVKPEVFLLGEGSVSEPSFFAYDGAYDWDLRGFGPPGALPDALDGAIAPEQLHAMLTRELPNARPLRFAENHDHPRAATLWGVGGSKVAHTILLTSRGYPSIFGGGEVGFAPPVGGQNDPVVWDFASPLYEHMKKIVAIRRRYLRSDLAQHWIPNDSASVYSSLSVAGTNRVLTVANLSATGTTVAVDLSSPAVGTIAGIRDLLRDVPLTYEGGSLTVTLEGWGTAVLLLE